MSKTPTVSYRIEDEKNGIDPTRRHSHQPVASVNPVKIRRNNTIEKSRLVTEEVELREKNKNKKISLGLKKPSEPDIPEIENSEDDSVNRLSRPASDSSLRVSYTKNNRKISSTSKSSKISDRGFVNEAYDQSNASSLHGSTTSLPVIREQYCCCKKWTRLEKILLAVCATLAIVIVGLIIALGVMGKSTDRDSRASILHF